MVDITLPKFLWQYTMKDMAGLLLIREIDPSIKSIATIFVLGLAMVAAILSLVPTLPFFIRLFKPVRPHQVFL